MLEIFFFVSLLGALYSYALYPLVLLLSKKQSKISDEAISSSLPNVSLVVTVHNEEKRIREKIENTLVLEYPLEKMEILIASDASTDSTNDIVKEYAQKNVKLIDVVEHKGKENAQLSAIKAASGSIIIFSDVATKIDSHGIETLVKYFNEPVVGAVSSEDRFISSDGNIAGEGAYVKYEMWLRQKESDLAGLVGLSGSFFAARKEVCEEWDIYSPSDFNTALNCAKKGFKAVNMPDVFGYYTDLKDSSKEYQRKIRTLIRGFTAVARHAEVLNFAKFGQFSFQVWSHKMMRWLVPWFLLALAISSIMLVDEGFFYHLIFWCQLVFYSVVTVCHFIPSMREKALFKIPYFFVQVNLAIAHASILFLSGKRMYTWAPSKR